VVEPASLSAEALRRQVERALEDDRAELRRRAHARLGFDGARRAAAHALRPLPHQEGVAVA
jgi:hypothetical protein